MVFQRGDCVYIMTNNYNKVLYVGITSDLRSRIWEHKNKNYPKSFTARYNCNKLVYYCFYTHIEEAINAEKLLKGNSRKHKQQLVTEMNPEWKDLYDSLLD